MARITELHEQWMDNPEYRRAYDGLADEFSLASTLIEERSRAGLTQKELARRMETTQPVVARLESGRVLPSIRTLRRLANATGSRLVISFESREPALTEMPDRAHHTEEDAIRGKVISAASTPAPRRGTRKSIA